MKWKPILSDTLLLFVPTIIFLLGIFWILKQQKTELKFGFTDKERNKIKILFFDLDLRLEYSSSIFMEASTLNGNMSLLFEKRDNYTYRLTIRNRSFSSKIDFNSFKKMMNEFKHVKDLNYFCKQKMIEQKLKELREDF